MRKILSSVILAIFCYSCGEVVDDEEIPPTQRVDFSIDLSDPLCDTTVKEGTYRVSYTEEGGTCGPIESMDLQIPNESALEGCELVGGEVDIDSCDSRVVMTCDQLVDLGTRLVTNFDCDYSYVPYPQYYVPDSGDCSITMEMWIYGTDNIWWLTDKCNSIYQLEYNRLN